MDQTAHARHLMLLRRAVWLIVFLAFVWRLDGLDQQSLWRDEVDAIYFALGDFQTLLSMFVGAGQNGALYFFSLRPWLRLVGSSEFALRYPSLLSGVLSIPLMWQVSRRLLPSPTLADQRHPAATPESGWRSSWQSLISEPALLATAVFAASPYQLWYSQEGKMYTATTLLALIAVWLWLRALAPNSGRGSWWGLFIIVTLGLYTHLLLSLLLLVFGVWSLVSFRQYRARALGLLLALLAVIAVYAYQAPWIWRLLTSPEPRTARLFVPLPDILKVTLSHQLNGVLPAGGGGIWLLPLLILAAAGMTYGHLVMPTSTLPSGNVLLAWERQLLIASWLVLPLLAIYILSLRQPVFAPRYIIWIAPALMMTLALGVQLLGPQRSVRRCWLATLLVCYVLGHGLIAGWQQKKTPIKYDLRSAVNFIAQRRDPEDLLILHIPHLEYAYRYYSGDQGPRPFDDSNARLGRWVGGLWTNNELAEPEAVAQVGEEMQVMTRGTKDIWVMRSEVEMWDARDLMDQWLRQHSQLVALVTFNGTQVIHYRMVPKGSVRRYRQVTQ